MAGEHKPFIEIWNLSHAYNPGTTLEVRSLSSVSLRIFEGEVVGIVGPNGSGKSTLLSHMNGLLRPQQGDVVVNGRSLNDPAIDIGAVRRMVGLVFQNPEDQLFERFVGDDISFGPRNQKLLLDEVRRRVKTAMELVGLPFAFKDRLTEELSRGEKRRVALAGILAMEPRVLALDEPTANLDPWGKKEVLDALARWHTFGEGGRTMILVSHSIDEILERANRVYLLAGGCVVLHGSTRDFGARLEVLEENGIQAPFGAALSRELLRRGVRVRGDVVTIEDAARELGALING